MMLSGESNSSKQGLGSESGRNQSKVGRLQQEPDTSFVTMLDSTWGWQEGVTKLYKRLQLLGYLQAFRLPAGLCRKWHGLCISEGNEKVKLSSQHTCGQLLTGMHCFFRHSVFPFTQAQMLQLTEDHISPSCGTQHKILLSGGSRRS